MKYTFTKANLIAVLKVIGWSVSATIVTTLIMVWQDTEVPAQYAFLVPMINVILYALKEFVSAKR